LVFSVLDKASIQTSEVTDKILTFAERIRDISINSPGNEFSTFAELTKDFKEMALVLFTERTFFIQVNFVFKFN
jgi:hypothetical protein